MNNYTSPFCSELENSHSITGFLFPHCLPSVTPTVECETGTDHT